MSAWREDRQEMTDGTTTHFYRRQPKRYAGTVETYTFAKGHGYEPKGYGIPQDADVSGSVWTCQCGTKSRHIWAAESWARRALIAHWNRIHSESAILRRGAC